MNEEQEIAASVDTSRRSVLNKLWIGLGMVALFEAVWLVVSFFRPQRSDSTRADLDPIVAAGPVSRFSKGSVTAFPRGRFYLACLEDGGFLAVSRTCTHLGCTVPWVEEEMRFVCPCHASAFDITGNVIHAPASRALDAYPVVIENDIVKVNTAKAIKRSRFEKNQVTYPG
jgi:Rieske Fe-S protein